jgi:hypothetical protein
MPGFTYQARSAYNLEERIHQDKNGGSVPKADSATRCETCGHVKEFHCKKFRKGEKPRGYLWVWNHENPRQRHPVRCKHAAAVGQFEPPLCCSASCSVSDCDCQSFTSPYRKPRAKETATVKPAETRKRATKPKSQELELAISSSDFGVPS